MKRIPLQHLAAAMLALTVLQSAGPVYAQYVWVDEKGVKQYSDMPPPPSVPASRILKQPGAASQPTEPSPTNTRQEPSTADKNVEFRKRKAEQAEKEKKAAEEARLAAEKSKNCERAREYQRALESGERISRTATNGERSFLTDEQRTQELNEARRIVQECR